MATLKNKNISTNISFTSDIGGIDTNFNYNYGDTTAPTIINANASKSMENGVNVSMSRSYQSDGSFMGASSNATTSAPFDEAYNTALKNFVLELFTNYAKPEDI